MEVFGVPKPIIIFVQPTLTMLLIDDMWIWRDSKYSVYTFMEKLKAFEKPQPENVLESKGTKNRAECKFNY